MLIKKLTNLPFYKIQFIVKLKFRKKNNFTINQVLIFNKVPM